MAARRGAFRQSSSPTTNLMSPSHPRCALGSAHTHTHTQPHIYTHTHHIPVAVAVTPHRIDAANGCLAESIRCGVGFLHTAVDLASGTPTTTAEVRVRVCGVASPPLPPSSARTRSVSTQVLCHNQLPVSIATQPRLSLCIYAHTHTHTHTYTPVHTGSCSGHTSN
jgi:hypothetical protein